MFFAVVLCSLLLPTGDADVPELGRLNIHDLEVDKRGLSYHIRCRIRQIVSEGRALVALDDGPNEPDVLVIMNMPTKRWVDGDVVEFEQLRVTGKSTYKTVIGGSKTVFVLEPVPEIEMREDRERRAKEAARRAAEREAARFRKFSDASGKFSIEAALIDLFKGQVTLERRDNRKKIKIALEKLSEADQKWVRDTMEKRWTERKSKNHK